MNCKNSTFTGQNHIPESSSVLQLVFPVPKVIFSSLSWRLVMLDEWSSFVPEVINLKVPWEIYMPCFQLKNICPTLMLYCVYVCLRPTIKIICAKTVPIRFPDSTNIWFEPLISATQSQPINILGKVVIILETNQKKFRNINVYNRIILIQNSQKINYSNDT